MNRHKKFPLRPVVDISKLLSKNPSRNNPITLIPSQTKNSVINKETFFINTDTKIKISIISYLTYTDFLQFQRISKNIYTEYHSHKTIKKYILHTNISQNEQLIFYESNIDIKEMFELLKTELVDYNIKSNIYQNILKLANESKNKDEIYSHVLEEIRRDINRTFYTEKFTKGNGQKMLDDILMALAFIRPEIGYCQGMNFIAGALINLIENEEKCFWIFLFFIDNIKLNLLFLKNMPDYSIRVFQLNYYINYYFPTLETHLKKKQINPDIFFSKWILTVFSNYLPFNVLYKVWDIFIIDKWKAVFKISMILLDLMKDKLINTDLGGFCKFFKSNQCKDIINFELISLHYNDYKITNKKLKELRDDFFIEKVKEKLNDPEHKWDTDQYEFVKIYENELKQYEDMIKEKIEQLQEEIEAANNKCEGKNKKYQEKLSVVKKYKFQLEMKIEVKGSYENVLKRRTINNINNTNNNTNNINIGINDNNFGINYSADKKKKGNSILLRIKSLKHANPPIEFRNCLENDNINNNYMLKSQQRPLSSSKKKKSEFDKIEKKIIVMDKEIIEINDELIKNYKILDKNKSSLDRAIKKKEVLKKKLDNLIKESQSYKRNLIKNLSEKLKLSEKFVATNKY